MKKIFLSYLLIFGFLTLSSQTDEQASEFIKKTHVALNKLQKEMIRLADQNVAPALKEAVKWQMAAVKSYKAGNFSEAFTLSYYSRNAVNGVLKDINQVHADYFAPTASDEQFIDHGSIIKNYGNLLSSEEIAKVENADFLVPQKLREFEVNLN